METTIGTATLPLSEYHALFKAAERLRSIERDKTGEIARLREVIDEKDRQMSQLISQSTARLELAMSDRDHVSRKLAEAKDELESHKFFLETRRQLADDDHAYQEKLKATLRVMYWVAVCLACGWSVTTVVLLK